MFLDLDLHTFAVLLLAISIGGLVKGIISFGFPLVALPILSLVLPIKSAIFLLFFSLIITNAREIKVKNWKKYKNISPLALGIFFGIIFGSIIFHKVDNQFISKIIGATIIFTTFINYCGIKIKKSLLESKLFSSTYGLFAGMIGGMTTIVGPLIVIYLVSLNFKKELFSELVSLSVFSTLIPLYTIFFIYQKVTVYDFFISALFIIPAILFQLLGFKIRRVIPQTLFKNIVLIILIIIGILILYKNF